MDGGIGANTVAKSPPVTPHFEAVGITCKPKKAEGSPESRKAFWGEEEQRNEYGVTFYKKESRHKDA